MGDVESDTAISAVDSATTVGKIKGKPAVKKDANGGKRWASVDLQKLWDHRHNFDEPSERKCHCTNCEEYWRGIEPIALKKNIKYETFAALVGRSDTACRIKVCKINYNVKMGAISLEDALAGKPLPLEPPRRVLEQAAEEGATSPRRALSEEDSMPDRAPKRRKQSAAEKPRSVRARKARKQTAAEKRESSSEDTLADELLSSQPSKPQEQAAAKKRVRSPKGASAGKLLPAFTPKPLKQAPAEKRASSSEDAVDEKPPCCQASQSRDHAPTESRACSPEDALTEVPQSCPASTPQQQISVEDAVRFRTADGGRIVSQHTAVERDVADALVNLSQWGNMTVAQRSHVLGEQLSRFNVEPDQQ